MTDYYLYIPATKFFHGEDYSVIFMDQLNFLSSCTGTFSFWARPISTSSTFTSYRFMEIASNFGGSEGRIRVMFDAGGTISVFYDSTVYVGSTIVTSANTFLLDEWYYICWTANEETGELKLYINGEYEAEGIIRTPLGLPSLTSVFVGDDNYDISIDSFSIYGTILTESQISQLYNDGNGTGTNETIFGRITNNGYYCDCDTGNGSQTSGRKIEDGEWSDVSGTTFNTDRIKWQRGGVIGGFMPKDAQFFYTSLDPDMTQSNSSQSIGGYPSNSLVYPEAHLLVSTGLYDRTFEADFSDNLSDWRRIEYISVNKEIIKVEPITKNKITVDSRGINNIVNVHVKGDIVQGLTIYGIFNNTLSTDFKQYRCLAVKNTSLMKTAYNTAIYVSQNALNNGVKVKVSVEIPEFQFQIGASTSWSRTTLVDTSLIGIYAFNIFADAYLKIKSGPNEGINRVVSSFDYSTGTFNFSEMLPVGFDYDSNGDPLYSPIVSYEIFPAPAQRVRTGTESPASGSLLSGNISTDFYDTSEDNPLYLNLTFLPDYVFYVWLERTVEKGASLSPIDNIFIDFSFSTSAS